MPVDPTVTPDPATGRDLDRDRLPRHPTRARDRAHARIGPTMHALA